MKLLLAGLFGVTLLAYLPVRTAQFVYEDETYVLPAQRALTAGEVFAPRGLTAVSFRLNALWGGRDPSGYHAVNVFLHLLVGVGVYALAARWLQARYALLASALFLLHPIQTEAVAYVAGRAELLAALGTLGVVWAVTAPRVTATHLGLALIGAVVAIGGKDLGVTAGPLALLALGWFRWSGWSWRVLGVASVGVLAICVLAWAVASVRMLHNPYVGQSPYHGFGYLCMQSWALWTLLRLVIWPVGFTIDHDLELVSRVGAMGSLAAGLIAVGLAWHLRRRWPVVSFGVFWMVLALLPRFFVPIPELLNEHQLYTPMIGIVLALSASVSHLAAWWASPQATAEAACVRAG